MVHAIRHRGPDSSGVWSDPDGCLALGHARLAIVDLTNEGSQPMVSHSGNLVLTLNGEIYNYIELRRELDQASVAFRGTSDTEVLLEAIERWGIEAAVGRARGMFALALWDLRRRRLWLARDRMGKKPLYVYEDADRLMFASEIKALVAVCGSKLTVSPQSVSDYLSLGFVVGRDTIYREVSELRPGTLTRIDLNSWAREDTPYWQFPMVASRVLSASEIQKETERLLCEAIRIRLRADVPVGVFLSGGIDSGLITALAASQCSERLKSFTVTFGASAFDESGPARLVAKRYGTDHHEFRLEPDLQDLLPKVVRAYDEPFADPSALPTFVISRLASQYVKVVLNGEGSDELFGGYRRAYAMRMMNRMGVVFAKVPGRAWHALLKVLPHPSGYRTPYSFLHRFARGIHADPYTRYLLWSSDGFDDDEKQRLMGTDTTDAVRPTHQVLRERLSPSATLSPLAEFMALDFVVGMADCLLPKIDIASMAHGLEGRSPFLDHMLVEWVMQVDKSDLLAGGGTKPILRDLARKYLPPEVVTAPKRGFEIPLVRWMTVDLYDMVRDVCTQERGILFDLCDRASVMTLLDRRVALEDERWAKRMWILFMLASWGSYVYEDRVHHA